MQGVIAKVDIATEQSTFASLPVTSSNFVLGSTFDAQATCSSASGRRTRPMPREPKSDGTVTTSLFASSATGLKFGNGLAFDAADTLFVSDAAEGAVYAIPPGGAVGAAAPWKKDALLTGDLNACPGFVAAFPIGANGIFVDAEAVWIGNTDCGSLVKIAREPGGAAGAVTPIVSDCAKLEGLDGLRPDPRDPTGAFIGTNNPKNTLVRITRAGAVSIVHDGASSYDGPADLVHVSGTSARAGLLVVSSASTTAFAPDAGLTPRPSLVRVTLP